MLKKIIGHREEVIFEVKSDTYEEGQWCAPTTMAGGPNKWYDSDRHHAVVEVTAHNMNTGERASKRLIDKEHFGKSDKAKAKAEKAARALAVQEGRNGRTVILNDGRQPQTSSLPPGAWPDPEPELPAWSYIIGAIMFFFACAAFWIMTPMLLYALGFR